MKLILFVLVLLYVCYKSVFARHPDTNVVTVEPENTYLKKGESLRITCKSPSRKPTSWYDPNGKIVPHQTKNRIYVQEITRPAKLSKTEHVLTLTSARPTDAGIWKCGTDASEATAEICVIDPAEFEEVEVEETVDERRSLSLTCQAQGDPEPIIYWYIGNDVITENMTEDKYIIGSKFNHKGIEGFLTIKSIDVSDQGVYTCVALQNNSLLDDCWLKSYQNITLYVNHAPRFTDKMERTTNFTEPLYVTENDVVNLNCNPSAHPSPKFRWFREREPSEGNFVEIPEKDFSIDENLGSSTFSMKVDSSVFGTKFVCKAKNEYGEAVANYEIIELVEPQKPPLLVAYPSDNEIKLDVTWPNDEKYKVTSYDIQYFQKKASFTPTREAHWKKATHINYDSDLEPQSGKDIEYVVSDLSPETEYWLRLRVGNRVGWSDWTYPYLFATTAFTPDADSDSENADSSNEDNTNEELSGGLPIASDLYSDIFFGLLLSGLILAFGACCILIVKRL